MTIQLARTKPMDAKLRIDRFEFEIPFMPTLGQWLSEDPLGFAAGDEHERRYVGNKMGSSFDPTGLITAGGHHGYPLYLGGYTGQPLIYLTQRQHQRAHKRLTELILEEGLRQQALNNARTWARQREIWSQLENEKRFEMIRISLLYALSEDGAKIQVKIEDEKMLQEYMKKLEQIKSESIEIKDRQIALSKAIHTPGFNQSPYRMTYADPSHAHFDSQAYINTIGNADKNLEDYRIKYMQSYEIHENP